MSISAGDPGNAKQGTGPSKVQGVCKKKGRAWHQGWHGASRPVVAGRADKNGGGKFLRHMADGPSVLGTAREHSTCMSKSMRIHCSLATSMR